MHYMRVEELRSAKSELRNLQQKSLSPPHRRLVLRPTGARRNERSRRQRHGGILARRSEIRFCGLGCPGHGAALEHSR
ncbi:unnamed protein product [Jaminaea pallidilutea]